MALAIGATRDAAEIARGRGMRAVRLKAVKADIAANLTMHDLSVSAVALRQRVTPRYIHMLFDGEGTRFSQYVLVPRIIPTVDPTTGWEKRGRATPHRQLPKPHPHRPTSDGTRSKTQDRNFGPPSNTAGRIVALPPLHTIKSPPHRLLARVMVARCDGVRARFRNPLWECVLVHVRFQA
jgi:hypothetical protein